MSDMKCPFCQQELDTGNYYVHCHNPHCDITVDMEGTEEMWQELIRAREELNKANAELEYIKEQVEKNNVFDNTRRALDVAKKWLMKIGYLNMSDHGLGSEKMMTDWCKTVALHGLKEIETALEQKDVKWNVQYVAKK